ncbi:MAG TPA: MFS transporter [Verrucomicrobiae bacterium]|nr:MFS transporter [Verrucomicrobiae bacterium]
MGNAYLFAMFNALSFQIIINSPMVLYAKSLGASATVLGIIVGMMPLLVVFQIPAAHYVGRVGYRRFVYAGWGTRVMFIFAMALVPLTSRFLAPATQISLLLLLLFGFNLSRGISSAGWLPWITALVPGEVRGRYLSRDAAFISIASFVVFLLAALWLGSDPKPWQFAVLFAFSAIMGAMSLVFLKRIPEVEVPPERRVANVPVPWGEMLRFPPFRKILKTVVAWSFAYGGMTAFTVAFLKVQIAMPERTILLVNSLFFVGGLSSLWFLGSRLDHFGSKPVLTFAMFLWVLIVAGWGLVAGKVMPFSFGLILALHFLMGLFAALVNMSNTRLVMAVVPIMGRDHFFALFSVLSNVVLGLSPIFWGLLIDAVGSVQSPQLWLEWNRFAVFFAGVIAALLVTLYYVRHLEEPHAASVEHLLHDILIQSPQRVFLRLWPR